MNIADLGIAVLSAKPIAFHPCLARLGGSATAGLFLSQLLYWTGKGADEEGWIFKSQAEWTAETCLSRHEQEQARATWKELGVLEEKREGLPCRLYYRIAIDRLRELLQQMILADASDAAQTSMLILANKYADFSKLDCENPHTDNTEITTEITTDISPELASANSGEREALPTDDLPFSDPPENEDIPVSVNPPRGRGTSAGRRRRRDADPRSKTPAIQCAKAVNGGRYPPLELYDDIIRILGPTPDGPRLAACRKEWLARGYNPQSWKWLLEWYVRGIPERAVSGETVYERSMQVIRAHLERSDDGERADDSGDVGFALCPVAKRTR